MAHISDAAMPRTHDKRGDVLTTLALGKRVSFFLIEHPSSLARDGALRLGEVPLQCIMRQGGSK